MTTPADVLTMLKDKEVKFVDLRFTDTRGKEQHVSVPSKVFDMDKFDNGHAFDGSSISGWKGIQASDMLLMPDAETAYIDPFMDETTLNITCDVVEPSDGKGYERDPRSLAKRAEAYLKSSGVGESRISGRSPSSSSSMPSSGRSTCRAAIARCSRPKRRGRRPRSSKAATWATGLR